MTRLRLHETPQSWCPSNRQQFIPTTSERQKMEGWESWYDGKAGANLLAGHPCKSRVLYVSDP